MILTFNAKSVGCDMLEKTLIGRKQMVDELYKELHQKCLNDETYQSLIIAPRGSGKTHLTKVLYCRLKEAKELQSKIVIAYLVEDEFGIGNFLHFCLRVLSAIDRHSELPDTQIKEKILAISELPSKDQENAISTYLRLIIEERKLVILIENLDTVLNGMTDNGAAIRDFMHEYNCLSLVATAQSLSKQFNSGEYPFYNFFKTRRLEKLTFEQAFELILALIDLEENQDAKEALQQSISQNNEVKNKIRAIYELTGGNHRLLVHFYGFLKADLKSDLSKVFVKQMNGLKTYYEQFVDGLSVQQQRIVQLLSLNHTPLQGKQIAQQSFLEANVVSKQLSELFKLGFIDKHKEGKNTFYEIREPLMRICFEINENQDGSVKLFVDFLRIICDETDRMRQYLKYKIASNFVEAKFKETLRSEASLYGKTFDLSMRSSLRLLENSLLNEIYAELEFENENSLKVEPNTHDDSIDLNIENTMVNESKGRFDKINLVEDGFYESINGKLVDSIYHLKMGVKHAEQLKFDNAIKSLEKSFELQPKNGNILNAQSVLYLLTNNWQKSIETINIALELDPKNVFFLGTSIQTMLYKNDWKSSERVLNKIFSMDATYTPKMVAEDVLESLFKWTPSHLLVERFIEVENYFISKDKLDLFYEAFTFAGFNILIRIEDFTPEQLGKVKEVLELTAKNSNKVILPNLFVRVGIDYLKLNDKKALYHLSKEERKVLNNQVLEVRKQKGL